MNTNNRGLLALFVIAAASPLAAQITTGFETTDGGYTNGATPGSDTSAGSSWAGITSTVASSANPFSGSLAVRITDSSASAAAGAKLNLVNSSAVLTDEFRVKFSMSVGSDISAGTGNQVWVLFGQDFVGTGNHWFRLNYDDGTLRLYTANGSGGGYFGVNLGTYASYSPLGGYVSFDITIDPTTHTYTNVSISGSLLTADKTSVVAASNGGTIPWSGAGAPGTMLNILTGGNDLGTVDFDALSVTAAIPESSTSALVFGSIATCCAMLRRRRSR